MDAEYYKKARKWYNTVYVDGASDRVVYFVIFLISCFSLYYSYQLISIVKKNKSFKNTFIILLEHKDKESVIVAKQLPPSNDQVLSLIELMLNKYVINLETLQYDSSSETPMEAIEKKTKIIKHLSGNDVYHKYMSSLYSNDNGDMSLAILKLKKTIKIKKIEFIYDNMNIFEKIYSQVLSLSLPRMARVYFEQETTREKDKKQNLVATISYNFYIDSGKKENSLIEFKVNDYYVEKNTENYNGQKK